MTAQLLLPDPLGEHCFDTTCALLLRFCQRGLEPLSLSAFGSNTFFLFHPLAELVSPVLQRSFALLPIIFFLLCLSPVFCQFLLIPLVEVISH